MKSSHANRGMAWERTLEGWHAQYAASGRACVVRTPPPMRLLRPLRAGQFVAVHASHGPPDYVGCSDGFALMLEAKHSAAKRWAFSNLHAHQAQNMTSWVKSGGHSFVLLHFSKTRQNFALDWRLLQPRWHAWHLDSIRKLRSARGAASFSPADIDSFGVAFDSRGWLDPVLDLCRSQSIPDDQQQA